MTWAAQLEKGEAPEKDGEGEKGGGLRCNRLFTSRRKYRGKWPRPR